MKLTPFLTGTERTMAIVVQRIQRALSLVLIASMLAQPVAAAAQPSSTNPVRATPLTTRIENLYEPSILNSSVGIGNQPMEAIQKSPALANRRPVARARNLAYYSPVSSNAKPSYPPNHIFDGALQLVGQPPTNHTFEQAGYPVGTSASNATLEAATYDIGTPPTNYNFESGNLNGWGTSGTVTVQNDATRGYWTQLQSNGQITSSAFTVDATAQQIRFDVGYLASSGTNSVEFWVHSGANYATQTRLKIFSCSNCGWRTGYVDISAYQGQSIKIRFKRIGGTIGIDVVRPVVLFPNYVLSGDVDRAVEANGNTFALIDSVNTQTSGAFTIDSAAQRISVRLMGQSTSADQYILDVFSGPNFVTKTQVSAATITDTWQTIEFDASSWVGQQIKLRVKAQVGTIGVDDIGLQSVVAPGWSISGDTSIGIDPDNNRYVSTNGVLVSSPITLPTSLQQLSLIYRYGGSSGNSFSVSILTGAAFTQEVQIGSMTSLSNSWQTLKFSVGTYVGQAIKVKLAAGTASRFHFDTVGVGEIALPNWSMSNVGEAIETASDANGSYIVPQGLSSSLNFDSQWIDTGIIDRSNGPDFRYYAISYDIGYKTGSELIVTWYNTQGQHWVVYSDASNTPTGFRTRYFYVTDFMGSEGYFHIHVTGNGKVYSIGDNIARQQLNEPFAHKVGLQIDTSTGSFGYQAQDSNTEGVMPLVFTRYYNSHSDRRGALGYGWSHTYETRLDITQEGDAGVIFGAGNETFFDWNQFTQIFTAVDVRIHDTLVKNGNGTYTFTTKYKQKYNFDASGKLISISDANSNTVALAYDSNGRLTTITAPGSTTFSLAYNGDGRLATLTDPLNAQITYTYDNNGDLVSVSRPDAGTESYSYNAHRLAQVIDANGNLLVQNSFDSLHRVVQQTDALSKTMVISYSTPSAGVTMVTDPEGNSASYYFDRYQRTTDRVDPTGATISYVYDNNGNLQKVVDAAFGQWSFAFDSNADLLNSSDPLGNPTQLTYNPDHLPTTIVDGKGNVTYVEYDNKGNTTKITDALGGITTFTYDTTGNLLTKTDPLGRVESYTYDAAGHQLSRTDAAGNTWQWTYTSNGKLKTETNPLGQTITNTYDFVGRLIAIRNPLGNYRIMQYDAVGNLLQFWDELGRTTRWEYDDRGLVKNKIDPAGKVISYAYDANRNMISMTDPLGHTTAWEYDSNNRVEKMIRANVATTTFSYDANGRPLSQTDALGRVTSYLYNSAGQITRITYPDTSFITYEYDASGNRIKTTDALGGISSDGYDALNRVTTHTDPIGHVMTYTYDIAGRMTKLTNAAGYDVLYSYDALDNMVAFTDPLGEVTSYQYDVIGNLTTITNALGFAEKTVYDKLNRPVTMINAAGHTTQFVYDAASQQTSVIEPSGGVTNFTYDLRGLRTQATNAAGQSTTYVYDDAERMIQEIDAANQSTLYSYDVNNRPVAKTDALGKITTYGYDLVDNLTSFVDPMGRTTAASYNVMNRLSAVTDAGGRTTSYTYNPAGKLTQSILPSGQATTYNYDLKGRLTSVTDPLNQTEYWEYDALDRTTRTTDRRGYSTYYGYDAVGRLTTLTDALSGVVQFGYDSGRRLTSLTDANGKVSSFSYDAVGNLLSNTDPLTRTHTYAYDAFGRLASQTDARGVTTSYSYDALDRVTALNYPNGSSSFNYDTIGRLTSASSSVGQVTYAYDANSRITGIATPQGTVAYTYNDAGQRTAMTLPNGRTINYGYDISGRLTSMTDWVSGNINFAYNVDGKVTNIAHSNGVNSSYSYDNAGRLTGINHSGAGGNLLSFTYALDANGNRVALNSNLGNESYALDPLNRLTQVTYSNGDNASYTYDPAGNRTSYTLNGSTKNYSYDDAGQLLSDSTTSFAYDANGNLTSAGSDSYNWDWGNRLTSASVGGVNATYTYDALNLRISSVISGVTASNLWDRLAENPLLLDDGLLSYVHSLGEIKQIDSAGNQQSLLGDALGSVRGIVDGSGALIGNVSYDVFGALRNQTGPSVNFGFTGELYSQQTGLLHLRARDYVPGLGRFLNVDTLRPSEPGSQGFNVYAYVANNPTTWVDPSGHGSGAGVASYGDGDTERGIIIAIMIASSYYGAQTLGKAIARVFLILACVLLGPCWRGGTGQNYPVGHGTGEPIPTNPNTLPMDYPGQPIPIPAPAPPIDRPFDPVKDAKWECRVECQIVHIPKKPGETPQPPKQPTPLPLPCLTLGCGISNPTETPDDSDGVLVFVAGGDGGDATTHIDRAINGRHLTDKLSYFPDGHGNKWYSKHEPCKNNVTAITRKDCDEYPFNRSYEGGETNFLQKKVDLDLVNFSDNRRLGSFFGHFLGACDVKDKQEFYVEVNVTSPTMGIRRDSKGSTETCYIAGN